MTGSASPAHHHTGRLRDRSECVLGQEPPPEVQIDYVADIDTLHVCPSCGEPAEVDLDEDSATTRSFIQNCAVCWRVRSYAPMPGSGPNRRAAWNTLRIATSSPARRYTIRYALRTTSRRSDRPNSGTTRPDSGWIASRSTAAMMRSANRSAKWRESLAMYARIASTSSIACKVQTTRLTSPAVSGRRRG